MAKVQGLFTDCCYGTDQQHAAPECAEATQFLRSHYCADELDADQVRRDCEHWERVAGDAERFPNADLAYIDKFTEAAVDYLALSVPA